MKYNANLLKPEATLNLTQEQLVTLDLLLDVDLGPDEEGMIQDLRLKIHDAIRRCD